VISSNYSGPSIKVSINLQQVAGGVNVTVTEVDGILDGDIRGVFFHLKDFQKVQNVTGTNVTSYQVGNNAVYDLGGGATMSGGGSQQHLFDIGVEIGTSGVGKGDDIPSTWFIVKGITLADIDFTQEFGVRFTTVGSANVPITQRTESAKVVGYAPSSCIK
jgi:hypothetical protein